MCVGRACWILNLQRFKRRRVVEVLVDKGLGRLLCSVSTVSVGWKLRVAVKSGIENGHLNVALYAKMGAMPDVTGF